MKMPDSEYDGAPLALMLYRFCASVSRKVNESFPWWTWMRS